MGVCEIRRIPCACVACTSMLDKPLISGISSDKQELYNLSPSAPTGHYQDPLSIGKLSNCHQKSSSSDTFDEIHQVVLDGISDNMASLVESGKYGAINTTDTPTNLFYVIMFASGVYKQQENTKI